MVDTKIRDYFRRKNRDNFRHDPATEFNFIPLWDKEFLYLLGLEEAVQFRLDLLDKTVYSKPKTLKTKGKKKKKTFPELAEEPSTPPKDPLICAQCKTDFSCSWKLDSNGLCLCQSCFKCNWRKEDQSSYRLKETSTSGSSSSSALFSQSINTDHRGEGGGAFSPSLSASAHFQSSDQPVPKVSAFHMSPDNTSSSFSSSSFSSDSSSCVYSSLSSDLLSSPSYDSSPFFCLPLSEDSSSPYYVSFSPDLYSSSSSLSPSPPRSSALYSNKKVERKSLTKEKQERKKPSTCYRPLQNKEKTEKICGSPSSASSSTLGVKQSDTQKAQVPKGGCNPSTPVLGARKPKFEPPKLMPFLKKMAEVNKEAMAPQANSPQLNQNPLLIQQSTPIDSHQNSRSNTSPGLLEPSEAQLKADSRLLGQSRELKTNSLILPNTAPSTSLGNTSQTGSSTEGVQINLP